jgi:hypothetical protein
LSIKIPALLLILKLVDVLKLKLLRNSVGIGVARLLREIYLILEIQFILLKYAVWLMSTIIHGIVGSVMENIRIVEIKLFFRY